MHHGLIGFFIISLGILTTFVHSKTNSQDVSALNVMFTSLNSPSQLSGWKSSGGDPCGDSWEGITCSGSAVTEIRLSDLELTGSLGYLLSNLKSVTYFDMSKNNLNNDIPYQLPPNLAYLDLSNNGFSGTVPYSISQMTDLKYLNLGHNQIKGQLTDMFQKLPKLKTLDLSHNSLSGSLPNSLAKLSGLNTLYLQNNRFTSSINVLAGLPLNKLNVENNKFTGWVPAELEDIDSIETGGNSWSSGPAPPPPPGAKPLSAKHKDHGKDGNGKNGMSGLAIALIVLASLVVLALLITLLSTTRKSSPSSHFLDEERGSQRAFTPLASQELSHDLHNAKHKEFRGGHLFTNAVFYFSDRIPLELLL